jgi:hypothetical protein
LLSDDHGSRHHAARLGLGHAANVLKDTHLVGVHDPARERQPIEGRLELQLMECALDDGASPVAARDDLGIVASA